MKLISISKSTKPEKKLMAIFETDTGQKKTTHFGASGYDDFTTFSKEERDAHKEHYITRHAKDLNTDDPTRSGYLSYYILWNKPTIKASIADYKRKFNL